MWMQNVLFRSKMLKLFFSVLPHICIRAREDTKNREYYNGWHFERTVEKEKQDSCFPSWLWILSSQVWTFLRSIDGRGGCWLSGKLWGAAPQRLGAHSEWVTPLLAGDHSTHWDSRQAKQGLEQDEGDRTHPSRPMRQPDRSKGVNHLQGNCNCNYMIASSGLEAVRVFKTHLS